MINNTRNLVGIGTVPLAGRSTSRMHVFNIKWDEVFVKENALLEAVLTEKIANFQTRLGYPAEVSVDDVIGYLHQSARLFSLLVEEARNQSSVQVRNIYNSDISLMFCGTISGNFSESVWGLKSNYKDDFLVTRPLAISNATWLRVITDVFNLVRIPLVWANLIHYYMSGYFTNMINRDEATDYMIKFQTHQKYSTEMRKTPWDRIPGLIAELERMNVDSPFLMNFLELEMGITNYTQEFDFTRDLAGNTVNLINDDEVIYALEANPGINYGFNNITLRENLDTLEVIYTPQTNYFTAFAAPRVLSVDMNEILPHMLFSTEKDAEGISTPSVMNTFLFIDNEASPLGLALPPMLSREDTVPTWIMRAVQNYALTPPYNALFEMSTSGTIVECAVNINEGYNLFVINEDDFEEVKLGIQSDWALAAQRFNLGQPINRVNDEGVITEESESENRRNRNKPRNNNKPR